MGVSKGMMVRQWWKRVFVGVLVLLGLTQVALLESHAQMRYNGGFVLTHRQPAVFAPESTTPKTTPAMPPSYFPDNDFSYSLYDAGGEPGRLSSSQAEMPSLGVSADSFPWNQPGFVDYNEPPLAPRDASISEPRKYSLEVTTLPPEALAARSETAVLIAHLPEQAAFWVEGTRTRSTGRTRYFQSPPLLPSRKYAYRVRALWFENGQWVSQTRRIPVEAGQIQAIYLRPSLPTQAKTNPDAATLSAKSARKALKE